MPRSHVRGEADGAVAEEELVDGGSDALIDALIPHGSAGEVAAGVEAHFEAGGDHVCVQALGDAWAADYVAVARELV